MRAYRPLKSILQLLMFTSMTNLHITSHRRRYLLRADICCARSEAVLCQLGRRGSMSSAARIGIGGPVGSGKTYIIEKLIPVLQERGVSVGVVTNDLVTKEDADRLRRSGALPEGRVSAVEAGACPHTVIREDPSLNILAADELEERFPCLDLVIVESGGDNLASTFSTDLVDWWMFVIDVAGGGDIPRKRGPGVLRSDLLVGKIGRA